MNRSANRHLHRVATLGLLSVLLTQVAPSAIAQIPSSTLRSPQTQSPATQSSPPTRRYIGQPRTQAATPAQQWTRDLPELPPVAGGGYRQPAQPWTPAWLFASSIQAAGEDSLPPGSRRGPLSPADFADLALPTTDQAVAPESSDDDLPLSDAEELPLPAANGASSPSDRRRPTVDPFDALPPELRGNSPRPNVAGPQTDSAAGGASSDGSPGQREAVNSAVDNEQSSTKQENKDIEYGGTPTFALPSGHVPGPAIDAIAQLVPYDPNAFLPQPNITAPLDPHAEGAIYRGKKFVPVQRPLLELGRPLYTGGIYPPAREWFGEYNPVMPHFMVYGDFRTGVGINRNANGDNDNWASRLNLDMDFEITATERIHAFMGPLDRGGDFTRLDFTNDIEFVDRTDIRVDNLFFEGDVGAMVGGLNGHDATFDLPIAFGFMPLFYQNGIWAADNVIGGAVAFPAKHNRLLKWSNYDATFFWASDQINSDAFAGDNNAAELFGSAWFIEAYDGYIEANYAFVHDDVGLHRSYHNFAIAFTKRYFHKISNSVRFITNFNQSLPSDQRTADGHLLLIENSLISSSPNTFVPYLNFFYGQGRTQSLARAGIAGGILNNTGINFETDGLNGFPTLDPTGVNTAGAALGVNMLGSNFDQQLVLEVAALAANGSQQFRNAPGDQYAFGVRYQRPLNHFLIFRTDHMAGILRNSRDIVGSRMELRWKF